MTSDKLTSIFGIASAFLGALAQQGVAPNYTGPASAVALALLGFYTNKR